MAEALAQWGFTSTSCEGEGASRAGILAAYTQLIADVRDGDAVVVYYTGHGGRSVGPAKPGGVRAHRTIQFIEPTDYLDSTEGDFRGITAVELSLMLARLTRKTKNVTVVLDCCHAAHMSRDRTKVVKARTRAIPYEHVAGHLRDLRRSAEWLDPWTPPGNPHAVRLVACAPEQSAYEYINPEGVRTGLLTDALVRALVEAKIGGLTVSWATLVDRVRQRVLAAMPVQRPEAEGPARRLLFDVIEADPVSTLPALMAAGRVRVDGAALLSVAPGDEFVIVPDEAIGPSDVRKLGDMRVDQVDTTAAWGELRSHRPLTALPIGSRAYLVRTAAPSMPVRLARADPRLAQLARALKASPLVHVEEPGERCAAEVEVDDMGALTVRDDFGPLHRPRAAGPAGIRQAVGDLTRLARARMLRRLSEISGEALPFPVSIEFGRVEAGQPVLLSTSGSVLYEAQSVYVRVLNESDAVVYVSLIDIGVAAGVSILTSSSPSGVKLGPGARYTFGGDDLTGVFKGVALTWPAELLREVPRPETILVLTTSEPFDSRVLEQEGVRMAPLAAESSLHRSLRGLGSGGRRNVGYADRSLAQCAVRTVDFDLVPTVAPPSEITRFEVDERPDAATWLWSSKSVPPTELVVRLCDLEVSGAAGVRLDTLVVTSELEGRQVCWASTVRIDGRGSPIQEMPVYRGLAVEYLDIAVWMSYERTAGHSLRELLRDHVPDLKAAHPEFDGLSRADPQIAAVISAIATNTAILNVAHRVLRLESKECVGIYRTTLLSYEQFGIGRPRGCTTLHPRTISFRLVAEARSGDRSVFPVRSVD